MMLTSTVPDKLLVTSFVYQMYQYFNRAMMSAISRDSQGQSPSATTDKASPFDLSAFDRFTFDKLSPVTSPQNVVSRSGAGQNVYSRHSRKNSLDTNSPPPADTNESSEAPLGVIQGKVDGENDVQRNAEASNGDRSISPLLHSTPKSSRAGEEEVVTGRTVSTGKSPAGGNGQYGREPMEERQSSVTPQVARVKSEERPRSAPPAHMYPPLVNGHTGGISRLPQPSGERDRTLEFENLAESEDSEELTTTSASSLDASLSSTSLLAQREGEGQGEGTEGRRVENGEHSLAGEGEKEEKDQDAGHKATLADLVSSSFINLNLYV